MLVVCRVIGLCTRVLVKGRSCLISFIVGSVVKAILVLQEGDRVIDELEYRFPVPKHAMEYLTECSIRFSAVMNRGGRAFE